jgi:DNA-binding phage protein
MTNNDVIQLHYLRHLYGCARRNVELQRNASTLVGDSGISDRRIDAALVREGNPSPITTG